MNLWNQGFKKVSTTFIHMDYANDYANGYANEECKLDGLIHNDWLLNQLFKKNESNK